MGGGNKGYFKDITAREQITNRIKKQPQQYVAYTCTSTNFEYTNVSVNCPTGHTYIVRARLSFVNTAVSAISASTSNTSMLVYQRYAYSDSGYTTFMLTEGQTAYIWGKWQTAGTNGVTIDVVDITN